MCMRFKTWADVWWAAQQTTRSALDFWTDRPRRGTRGLPRLPEEQRTGSALIVRRAMWLRLAKRTLASAVTICPLPLRRLSIIRVRVPPQRSRWSVRRRRPVRKWPNTHCGPRLSIMTRCRRQQRTSRRLLRCGRGRPPLCSSGRWVCRHRRCRRPAYRPWDCHRKRPKTTWTNSRGVTTHTRTRVRLMRMYTRLELAARRETAVLLPSASRSFLSRLRSGSALPSPTNCFIVCWRCGLGIWSIRRLVFLRDSISLPISWLGCYKLVSCHASPFGGLSRAFLSPCSRRWWSFFYSINFLCDSVR